MRTVGEVYPSQWLHASDLMKRSVTVENVAVQEFRQQDGRRESRIVIGFLGAQRRLVCNKTQAIAFAAIAGTEEFDQWVGLRVLWKVNNRRGRAPRREAEECRASVRCSCGRLVEMAGDNDLRACACGNLYRLAMTVWTMDGQTVRAVMTKEPTYESD